MTILVNVFKQQHGDFHLYFNFHVLHDNQQTVACMELLAKIDSIIESLGYSCIFHLENSKSNCDIYRAPFKNSILVASCKLFWKEKQFGIIVDIKCCSIFRTQHDEILTFSEPFYSKHVLIQDKTRQDNESAPEVLIVPCSFLPRM